MRHLASCFIVGAVLASGLASPAHAVDIEGNARTTTYLQPALRIRTQSITFAAGYWWSSQAYPGTTEGAESLTISRMSRRGQLIDSMQLVDSSHGSNIAVQVEAGSAWVWAPWRSPSSGDVVLTRTRYTPGLAVLFDDPDVEEVPIPGTGSQYPAFDPDGWLVVREVTRDGVERFVRRRVEEALAGVDAVHGVVETGPLLEPYDPAFQFQGHASIGGSLYRLAGLVGTPMTVARYSWESGELVSVRDVSHVVSGRREPEGITAYVDAAGRPALLFGVVAGWGARRYPVFNLGDPANDACHVQRRAFGVPGLRAVVRRVDCARWVVEVRSGRPGRVGLSAGGVWLGRKFTGLDRRAVFRLVDPPSVVRVRLHRKGELVRIVRAQIRLVP